MTDAHLNPEVRRRVFETVTLDEALTVMRSRIGRPWTQAATEIVVGGLRETYDLDENDGAEDALAYVQRVNRE